VACRFHRLLPESFTVTARMVLFPTSEPLRPCSKAMRLSGSLSVSGTPADCVHKEVLKLLASYKEKFLVGSSSGFNPLMTRPLLRINRRPRRWPALTIAVAEHTNGG